ncbi:AraC family transcriptional regulator [Lachnospiraceae bacterium ZAX-1]
MQFTEHDLAWVLYASTGILLSKYDGADKTVTPLTSVDWYSSAIDDLTLREKLIALCLEKDTPQIVSNRVNCLWFGIPYGCEVYMIGPTLIRSVPNMNLPVVPYDELLKYFSMLYALLYHKEMSFKEYVFINPKAVENTKKHDEAHIYEWQERNFTAAREVERFLVDCVRNGDVERLQQLKSNSGATKGHVGLDALRQEKNSFIVMMVLIGRAAIEGGLSVEVAFPLSDMYILQMEAMTDIPSVLSLMESALLDWTERVRANKSQVKYSEQINACCDYIIKNISVPIKVGDVAEFIGLNAEYLSRRFRKETGVPIPQYIIQAKMDEAVMLLSHTSKPIAVIASLLGFPSQSKFTTVFKRSMGTTPDHYRKTH